MLVVYLCIGTLALLLLIDIALTLGLATRLRTLQEDFQRGAMRDPELPRVGDAVGAFEATTTKGEPLTQATITAEATLVGIFAPGCADCKRVRSQLLAVPPKLPFVAFIDCYGPPEIELEARTIAEELAPIAKVVLTRQGEAPLRAFHESGVPTLIRVDRGVVSASGHRLAEVLPDVDWAALRAGA